MGMSEKFVKDGVNRMTQEEVKRAAKNTARAKHKANVGILKQLVTRIHEVADMLNDYADRKYREVPYWSLCAISFLILYVANPLDCIPDFIPVLGFVDDLAVATIVLAMVEQDIKNWRVWRKAYDKEEKQQTEDENTKTD